MEEKTAAEETTRSGVKISGSHAEETDEVVSAGQCYPIYSYSANPWNPTWVCPACDAENSEQVKVCGVCGAARPAAGVPKDEFPYPGGHRRHRRCRRSQGNRTAVRRRRAGQTGRTQKTQKEARRHPCGAGGRAGGAGCRSRAAAGPGLPPGQHPGADVFFPFGQLVFQPGRFVREQQRDLGRTRFRGAVQLRGTPASTSVPDSKPDSTPDSKPDSKPVSSSSGSSSSTPASSTAPQVPSYTVSYKVSGSGSLIGRQQLRQERPAVHGQAERGQELHGHGRAGEQLPLCALERRLHQCHPHGHELYPECDLYGVL